MGIILAPVLIGMALVLYDGSERTGNAPEGSGVFDVKSFGATGDGTSLDVAPINRAIEAASAAGGGTVRFPAGRYLSSSIHLRSNVGLFLEHGDNHA